MCKLLYGKEYGARRKARELWKASIRLGVAAQLRAGEDTGGGGGQDVTGFLMYLERRPRRTY